MRHRFPAAAFAAAFLLAPVLAQADPAAARAVATRSYDLLLTVDLRTNGSESGGIRRCKAYMDEAASADKLGAHAMAAKHWERAARGCRAEAVTTCRMQKGVAPGDRCEQIQR